MSTELSRLATIIHKRTTEHLTKLGELAECRPLSWSIRADHAGWRISGQAGAEYDDHQTSHVLDQWSQLLGLTWQDATCPGTQSYRGQAGWLTVEIWGVTDRTTFDTLHRLTDDDATS